MHITYIHFMHILCLHFLSVICFVAGGSHVCVSGFVSGSSEQVCGDVFPESQGCTDTLISEKYLTLNFTDRVECWEIQQPQNKLVWKREQDLSDHTGNIQICA